LLSPYATDKYAMELYAGIANKIYQLSTVGLRFFNVYGPRQDPGSPYSGVISIFANRLLKEQDITINGGHQTRDFIYVSDVTNIIYRAVTLASKSSICETSNVLTGKSVSIDDLAKKMMKIIDVKVKVSYKSLDIGDPEQSNGSSKKMARIFGINPNNFIKLDNGLMSTIQYILK
ncbi:NAD-dependent epimerase/dehydratase family protein, partial [Alphaproteobacteria bacterium]|nr:NAD-dependent epimerase/dehydratase family protein [Alphaproteobacteria bacterium]